MAEWYQNLLKFASKKYDFDIRTFKIKNGATFSDSSREIFTFIKNDKEYIIDFEPGYLPQRRQTRAEMDFIDYLAENNISVAKPLKTVNNELVLTTQEIGVDFNITAFEMVGGCFWNKNDPDKWNDRIFFNWGKTMGDMHRLAKSYKSTNRYKVPDIFDRNYTGWGAFFDCLKVYPAVYKVTEDLLAQIIDLPKDKDSYGLIHCDLHPYNFYIDVDKINIFDFNDNIYAWFALDIGIALFHGLDWGRKDDAGNDYSVAIIDNFLKGYLSANYLSNFWLSKIPMFMKYRQIWFDVERMDDNQKDWKYNIENNILFDGFGLKQVWDIIKEATIK